MAAMCNRQNCYNRVACTQSGSLSGTRVLHDSMGARVLSVTPQGHYQCSLLAGTRVPTDSTGTWVRVRDRVGLVFGLALGLV